MALDIEQYLKHFRFKRIKKARENYMASCPNFDGLHARGDLRPSFGIRIEPPHLANCFFCDLKVNLEQLTAKLLTRDLGRPVNEYEAWLWLEEKGWVSEPGIEGLKQKLESIGTNDALDILDEGVLDEFVNGVHPSIIYGRGITVEAAKEWELRYDKRTNRTIIPV